MIGPPEEESKTPDAKPASGAPGDYMIWDAGKEYVQIVAGDMNRGTTRTVAVIRLDKGQSVKEMAGNAATVS